MAAKRQIRSKEIVGDIRSGMSSQDLLQKYQISEVGLQKLLKKLLDANLILDVEASALMPSGDQPGTSSDPLRKHARSYVMVRLPVYDLDDLTAEGLVHDISEKGLMLGGIKVTVGDTKKLLIQADEFADVYPFTFDAECRWVKEIEEENEVEAGFRITSISDVGLGELRKLCSLLAIQE